MSRESREAYTGRLLRRVLRIIDEEKLYLNDLQWDELTPADQMFLAALTAYEDGDCDKDEVDGKAISYLNHWREHGKDERAGSDAPA